MRDLHDTHKQLLAVLAGFLLVPLALGLLQNHAAFEPGYDPPTLRARDNLQAMAIAMPVQLAVALAALLGLRGRMLARPGPAAGAGAVAGVAGAVALMVFGDLPVAHPWRLGLLLALAGSWNGFVSFAACAWLNRPPPPLVPDRFQEAGLAAAPGYALLGSEAARQGYGAGVPYYVLAGWAALLVCLGLVAFGDPPLGVRLALLGFAGLAGYLIVSIGRLTVTPQRMIQRTRLGTWAMDWNDVRTVEVTGDLNGMVLEGDDKRMAFPHPRLWSGQQAGQARLLLAEVMKSRALEPQVSGWAAFKWNRNTRTQHAD